MRLTIKMKNNKGRLKKKSHCETWLSFWLANPPKNMTIIKKIITTIQPLGILFSESFSGDLIAGLCLLFWIIKEDTPAIIKKKPKKPIRSSYFGKKDGTKK